MMLGIWAEKPFSTEPVDPGLPETGGYDGSGSIGSGAYLGQFRLISSPVSFVGEDGKTYSNIYFTVDPASGLAVEMYQPYRCFFRNDVESYLYPVNGEIRPAYIDGDFMVCWLTTGGGGYLVVPYRKDTAILSDEDWNDDETPYCVGDYSDDYDIRFIQVPDEDGDISGGIGAPPNDGSKALKIDHGRALMLSNRYRDYSANNVTGVYQFEFTNAKDAIVSSICEIDISPLGVFQFQILIGGSINPVTKTAGLCLVYRASYGSAYTIGSSTAAVNVDLETGDYSFVDHYDDPSWTPPNPFMPGARALMPDDPDMFVGYEFSEPTGNGVGSGVAEEVAFWSMDGLCVAGIRKYNDGEEIDQHPLYGISTYEERTVSGNQVQYSDWSSITYYDLENSFKTLADYWGFTVDEAETDADWVLDTELVGFYQ